MDTRRIQKKPKYKSFAAFAGVIIGLLGAYRHMTVFPEPGAVGQGIPELYETTDLLIAERLEADTLWLCEDIGRRSSRYSARSDELVGDLERALREAGFELETQDYMIGTSAYHNVVGTRPGTGSGTVLVGTHYDSYGKSICANASASGVAVVLETLRAIRSEPTDATIIVAFFGTGEKPHNGRDTMGAQVWVDAQMEAGRQIDAAYLIGSFGCFRQGAAGQNSSFPWYISHPESMDWVGVYGSFLGHGIVEDTLAAWGKVTDLPARGFASPSWMLGIPAWDQVPFQDAGIPSVLLSDTGDNRDTSLRTPYDVPYVMDFKEMARRVDAFTTMLKVVLKTSPTASVASAG